MRGVRTAPQRHPPGAPRHRSGAQHVRDRIGVLVPKRPITVAPTTAVGEVLKLMVKNRIGCVVVAEGDRPVGIFSERDALRKLRRGPANSALIQ